MYTMKKVHSQFRLFWGQIFTFMGILFSLGQMCMEKIINLHLRGKFYFSFLKFFLKKKLIPPLSRRYIICPTSIFPKNHLSNDKHC